MGDLGLELSKDGGSGAEIAQGLGIESWNCPRIGDVGLEVSKDGGYGAGTAQGSGI